MWQLAVKYPIESLATFITAVPIITFMIRSAHHKKAVRFFFIYLVAKFCIELLMFYMASEGMNNLFLGNILTIVTYCLIAKMFHEAYEGLMYKKTVTWCSVVFFGVVIIDTYRDGFIDSFRYSSMFECIFIMTFSLLYFHELIRHPRVPNLFAYPFFWLCSALILYFATMVFVAPLGYYLDRWPVNHTLYVFTLIPSILESAYLLIVSFGIMAGKS